MNSEEQKEFNRQCAEFMNYSWLTAPDGLMVTIPPLRGFRSELWNPYSNANDRNKVLEKMRIDTKWIPNNNDWTCASHLYDDFTRDKSMEAAQIKCIQAVLNQRG